MHHWLRDPLLHFALLGAALFAVFTLTGDETLRDDRIVVSAAQQEQLAAAFQRTWRRPPSAADRESLIEEWVREEMAFREAGAMGLAEGDPVVRRRLRQKYEAFMQQLALPAEPDDEELEEWRRDNLERYRQDARYTLSQRFFSADRREDAAADATQALTALATDDIAAGSDIGDALALPQQFRNTRATELANRLGEDFASALPELPLRRWTGPVPSAYGYHLVFIEAAPPAVDPPLAAVRENVLRDWRDARLREARERLYDGLHQRYSVELEPLLTAD